MKILIHYLFLLGMLLTCFSYFLKLIYLLFKPRLLERKFFDSITAAPSKKDLIIYNLVMILAILEALNEIKHLSIQTIHLQ